MAKPMTAQQVASALEIDLHAGKTVNMLFRALAAVSNKKVIRIVGWSQSYSIELTSQAIKWAKELGLNHNLIQPAETYTPVMESFYDHYGGPRWNQD